MPRADHSTGGESGPERSLGAPHEGTRRRVEEQADERGRETAPPTEATLDPLFCQLAVNQTFDSFVQRSPADAHTLAALPLREDLQNLLNGLARRVAWGGDRRKGSARIELSEGALAGATLVVHADQRTINVELELPAGMAAQGWQERITQRLERRGLSARVRVG